MGNYVQQRLRASCHLLFTARPVTRQQGAFEDINPTQTCSMAGYNFCVASSKAKQLALPGAELPRCISFCR